MLLNELGEIVKSGGCIESLVSRMINRVLTAALTDSQCEKGEANNHPEIPDQRQNPHGEPGESNQVLLQSAIR